MTDWTSISVTEEQKAILEGHKPEEKAMGRFLVGVVEGDNDPDIDVDTVAEAFGIPEGARPDSFRDELNSDVQEQLDRIESGVREATNAAQSADKKLEELGR